MVILVRCLFDAVFDVPLARCAGVGAHRSPAPDRRPQAVCQKTAEADCRRPSVFPDLGGLALSAGHRQTRDRDRLASQGISPFLDLEDPARTRRSSGSSAGRSQPHPYDEPGEPDSRSTHLSSCNYVCLLVDSFGTCSATKTSWTSHSCHSFVL